MKNEMDNFILYIIIPIFNRFGKPENEHESTKTQKHKNTYHDLRRTRPNYETADYGLWTLYYGRLIWNTPSPISPMAFLISFINARNRLHFIPPYLNLIQTYSWDWRGVIFTAFKRGENKKPFRINERVKRFKEQN